jgi:hypothetical protein
MAGLPVFRCVTLPRAIRICLPTLGGETILLLEATALASTVTAMDMLGVAPKIRFDTRRTCEPLLAATIINIRSPSSAPAASIAPSASSTRTGRSRWPCCRRPHPRRRGGSARRSGPPGCGFSGSGGTGDNTIRFSVAMRYNAVHLMAAAARRRTNGPAGRRCGVIGVCGALAGFGRFASPVRVPADEGSERATFLTSNCGDSGKHDLERME